MSTEDQKQTWSLPDEPGPEVKAVRTASGKYFHRNPMGYWYGHRNGTGYNNLWGWWAILRDHGTLTDATDEVEEK